MGQELIQNVRVKKFVQKVERWEIAIWVFRDKKGRLPNDTDNNGSWAGPFKTDMINAHFMDPPYEFSGGSEVNTITIGSYKFYFLASRDGPAANLAKRNVIVICKDYNEGGGWGCPSTFSEEELLFMKAFDRAVDGEVDGSSGRVRGHNGSHQGGNWGEWFVMFGGGFTFGSWTSGTTRSLVYYFERVVP